MTSRSPACFLAACVLTAATSSDAAVVAHEGFDAPPLVNNLLTSAGHTASTLSPADIESGLLLSGGYQVFVMSRNSACGGPSEAYANAVGAFVEAGGNVVTEWAGGPMFFTSDAPGVFCAGSRRLGIFAGVVHAGGGRGLNTPIDVMSPSHPVFAGISDPMLDGDGTDFMHWIENPDPRLEVLGQVTGNGGNFPTGQNLPVILTGCVGRSRFVFGLHDYGDTVDDSAVAQTFLLNSVAYAAEGCNPCPDTPDPFCLTGESASLQIRNDDNDAKDSLKWKLSKGQAFDQAMLGSPSTTRSYALCIYDETGGSAARVGSVIVAPGPLWLSRDPKGFKYTDKLGTENGASKIALKTGTEGRSSAQFAARGVELVLPAAATATEMFDQDTRVVVQLVNDESGLCFTSEFEAARTNTVESFKASAP